MNIVNPYNMGVKQFVVSICDVDIDIHKLIIRVKRLIDNCKENIFFIALVYDLYLKINGHFRNSFLFCVLRDINITISTPTRSVIV